MAVLTVGWLISVGTERVTEIEPIGVGPKGGVDNFDVLLADGFGVVAVVFIETFL